MYPANKEYENSVLSCMLLNRQVIEMDVINNLTSDDFFFSDSKAVFEAMITLFSQDREVSPISLEVYLESVGEKIPWDYLESLMLHVPQFAAREYFIKELKGLTVKRKLLKVAEEITQKTSDDTITVDELLTLSEKLIMDIGNKTKSQKLTRADKDIKELITHFNNLKANKNYLSGVSTGYPSIDRVIGGLQKESIVIIAGATSMGKTAFALNIVADVVFRQNKTVAFFSIEMSKMQLYERLISSLQQIEMERLRSGYFDKTQYQEIIGAINEFKNFNLYQCDSGELTPLLVKTLCRRLKHQQGLDLIVIDYLQLMKSHEKSKNDSKYNEVSQISGYLKQVARELKVPIILLAQLNREISKRADKRPLLSDLRESGAIEQDSDQVLFLYREKYYKRKEMQKENEEKIEIEKEIEIEEASVIIEKNRHGKTCELPILFDKKYVQFCEYDEAGDQWNIDKKQKLYNLDTIS